MESFFAEFLWGKVVTISSVGIPSGNMGVYNNIHGLHGTYSLYTKKQKLHVGELILRKFVLYTGLLFELC